MNDDAIDSILVLMRGVPGSGKSYLAEALRDRFGGEEVVMLDPDATDYESEEYKEHSSKLTEEGVDPKLHAYRFLRAQAYDGIAQRKIIIWNQPFTNLEIFKKMIKRMQDHAAENKVRLAILIVEVEIDPEKAKDRVEKRKQDGGHGPSDEGFMRFVNDYTSFAHLGFKTVAVHGESEVSDSAALVVKTIEDMRGGQL